ncbi:Nonribosomal peptide synthase 1 [Cladobotryum mycophilum]|uniref:Nonribosomal peptide synthase 1 n=1 Tax=Cladobotryum mycophilum TaxID=491253 RepID=A0ABR0S936_9HYPO
MYTIDDHGSGGVGSGKIDWPNTSTIPAPETISDKQSQEPTNSSSSLTAQHLQQLWQWNQTVPPLLQTCMHDIISEKAQEQPQAPAVQSWDGTLTYQELEHLSSQLARQLRQRGISVGSRIPLCFEKSMWAVVAVLAVMKSGATFSLTDSSQPEARLRTIVEQTGAELVITSVAQSELGNLISNGGQVLAISRGYFDSIEASEEPLPQVPSSTPMYIIFTSGSTGKPKGVVISHENYTSGAIPRADAVGYKPTSRCFDFPSYAFDVSIDCMVCTLAVGGTICVPSEEGRMNDLSGAIRQSKANMVHMTPSVARVLDSDIIPSLDVLGLGGEAVSASDASAWSQNTSLIIAYGPSECTVGCTINNTVTISTGIGKGVGGVTWIVDPDDHNKLVEVGGVGELIVEGPVVGIGYLDEPEKTAEVFIEDPVWLTAGHVSVSGRSGRLYKTGDLVRYESNGLGGIEFVGRKDQQVKLRGQRVELAEVEHHLQACLPSGIKVAAEVIKSENGGAPSLVAFLSEPSTFKSTSEPSLVEPSSELRTALAIVNTTMGSRVPRYMVPAAFITLENMPSLVSGKIDRKKLREIGVSIPREVFSKLQAAESLQEDDPETEEEKKLHTAWLKVLGQETKAYKQSNFFGLGGDSLRAMRLVAASREEGVALTVADIFMNPTLESMATKATPLTETSQEDILPFSLLEKDWDVESACRETADLCEVKVEDIEDIYPCTPLQEALMALSAKVKEAYVAQRVVRLADITVAERLIAAFDIAQQDCSILRTRIVQVPGRGLVQVIIRSKLEWYSGSNLDEYLHADRESAMDLGKSLVRYAVIDDASTGKVDFVLSIHHALYDGWSMPLVVDRVNQAFNNQAISRPAEFKHFIKYLATMEKEKSADYWREQLNGANGPQFPSLPWQGYQPKADSLLEIYVPLDQGGASNATVATIIRAAWALVTSQYINSTDIVFGETLTGRNAPIIGAEEIEGPMITTVPVRIQIDRETAISEYLQIIQEQTVEQIPHEHFGLQHIRRLSPDAFVACELRTGLVLHPSAEEIETTAEDLPANRLVPAGDAEAAQEALKFNTYALMLVCSIDPRGFLVMASFDSNTITTPVMQRALEEFKQAAQSLCERSGSVQDIRILTDNDHRELRDVATAIKGDEILSEYSGVEAGYITDPRDSNRLVPIGGLGELILQSTELLGLEEISRPIWLANLYGDESVPQARFFKAGKFAKVISTSSGISIQLADSLAISNAQAPSSTPANVRVSATSQRQRKLRGLWSRVLRLPEGDIGLNDSFFLLGGDSIAAMKLASEARLDGIKLSVAQIFEKRTLYEMANSMEELQSSELVATNDVNDEPFSLLDIKGETSEFVESVIRPRLGDQSWVIENVLPTRPLQQIAVQGTTNLPRFSARYELIYFEDPIDRTLLAQSCRDLVARNEILRTVFVKHENEGYAAVLKELVPQFIEYAVENDVESFAKQLCGLDVLTTMPLGSPFVKFFLIQSPSRSCLIFRLSHAQYDEICLPIMLNQLSSLYAQKPVQPSAPYSSYVAHVLRQNIPSAVPYWTDLLAGSSLTEINPHIPIKKRNHFAIQQTVDISSRPRDITIASLPTAAWALTLAQRLSLRDVTFGEVVSGRNIDFPSADRVTGPCWQYIPVRISFDPDSTPLSALSSIQAQHIASSAHEGISLSEIATQCTSWLSKPTASSDLWFPSVVHQDVEHVTSLPFSSSTRLETFYPHEEPLREWKIQSWAGYAEGLLEDLCGAMGVLVGDPNKKLFDE